MLCFFRQCSFLPHNVFIVVVIDSLTWCIGLWGFMLIWISVGLHLMFGGFDCIWFLGGNCRGQRLQISLETLLCLPCELWASLSTPPRRDSLSYSSFSCRSSYYTEDPLVAVVGVKCGWGKHSVTLIIKSQSFNWSVSLGCDPQRCFLAILLSPLDETERFGQGMSMKTKCRAKLFGALFYIVCFYKWWWDHRCWKEWEGQGFQETELWRKAGDARIASNRILGPEHGSQSHLWWC